jgi:hypothetical protein
VTVVISALCVYGKSDTRKSVKRHGYYRFIFPKNYLTNYFSFADEVVPVNDVQVTRKMKHSLTKSSYNHIQSYILQEEAAKLFPIIVPILKYYGIPEDFKYLPLVEAGLKSGVSKSGAAGWWQFMPGTARTYGLKVGHGRDDRYNIRRSTAAACKYLKELHAQFHSWTLAAAAYNIGEIKMARAIKMQGERNYYKMHFNAETGSYLYRVIAMKQVIEQPELYGYTRKEIPTVNFQPTGLLATND